MAGSFRTFARKPYPPLRKQLNKQFKGKNGKNKFCRIEPARGRGKPLLVKANYVKALTRIVSAFSPARRLPAFGSHLRRAVCRKCRIYSFYGRTPCGRCCSSRPFPPFPPAGGLSTPFPQSWGNCFPLWGFYLNNEKNQGNLRQGLDFFLLLR